MICPQLHSSHKGYHTISIVPSPQRGNVPGKLRVRLVERGKAIDFYFFTSVPTNVPTNIGNYPVFRNIQKLDWDTEKSKNLSNSGYRIQCTISCKIKRGCIPCMGRKRFNKCHEDWNKNQRNDEL